MKLTIKVSSSILYVKKKIKRGAHFNLVTERCETKIKLFGLQWQEALSKDVPGEYRVRISGEQRLVSAHASTHELD